MIKQISIGFRERHLDYLKKQSEYLECSESEIIRKLIDKAMGFKRGKNDIQSNSKYYQVFSDYRR
jgi:hypothetical protein